MKIEDRPTEMLLRQLLANRQAARRKDHFAHLMPFRPHFVREMLEMRQELRKRHAGHSGVKGTAVEDRHS